MATAMMMNSIKMSSSTPSLTPPSSSSASVNLPVRTIPGSYGLPLIGPISDRLDYFWFQGPETFFKKRMEEHKSSVFRTNIPPTFPLFVGVNPNMIAVLDCKAFAHLFDMDLVEKKNILIGDFMPSTSFTGNMRVGVYLDTTEPLHSQVKSFAAHILKRSSSVWVSEFISNLDIMWGTIEKEVKSNGSSSFLFPLQKCIFRFLTKSLFGADPMKSSEIGDKGHEMLDKWLALQLLPTQTLGVLPQPLEEILFHSFAYPFLLVSGDYNKLFEFVKTEGKEVVEIGMTEYGLNQEETIHNLLFILGFNAFGGFSVFLPSLLVSLGGDKTGLQEKLRKEVKEKVGSSSLSFSLVKEMELVNSFVYETLRFIPPVPFQYARARKDFVLSSYDSAFQVKKGELLCGYQPLVMKDPKVFDNPETFVADRFTKEKGQELLNYLYWSNGPQTGTPATSNKQCSAKDIVVLTASLLVADVLTRYDSFTVSSGSVTAVEKAK
ncbi:hypothetical protein C5167_039126 [Papaver somniferum]|uniref:Uncharacterized protein n=1 Tax=Papaver somniferum TaxID=3469 RepID=A0A4Y7IEQ4_PAPSO|nr:fatty acid hydroperoxide lyase, chloroplastic-like [Papaver somniferum]RZC46182.1 hypothetical protein C5167_039126 [Papaver somniferum]